MDYLAREIVSAVCVKTGKSISASTWIELFEKLPLGARVRVDEAACPMFNTIPGVYHRDGVYVKGYPKAKPPPFGKEQ
jgi:hypothetical protein